MEREISETEGEKKDITLDAVLDNLVQVNGFLEDLLEGTLVSTKTRLQLELVVEEIFVNIASYAYEGAVGKTTIEGCVGGDPPYIELCFMDEGVPYNPLAKEDPDTTLAMEERRIGGLGIYLVKNNVDEIAYEYAKGKNILSLKKALV